MAFSDVSSVINLIAKANEGFVSTSDGTISSGATSVPLTNVVDLEDGSVFVGVIEPGEENEQTFTGTVDFAGSQITDVVWTRGTNVSHAGGVTVVDYVTGTAFNMLARAFAVSHNQDGTIKNDSIDSPDMIADGTLTNDNMATAIKPVTILDETTFDHVASGCVWTGDAYGSTRNASMTAGVVYINGKRVPVSAVTARAFTASKDTYIDVGEDGVVDYNPVNNNDASPTLADDHIRIGIIVTGASNILDVGSINQGQNTKILPAVSSVPCAVTDSLGNLICSRDPQRTTLGYREIVSTFSSSSISGATISGLSVPIKASGTRKVRITLWTSAVLKSGSAGDNINLAIQEGGSNIEVAQWNMAGSNYALPVVVMAEFTPTAGLHTYTAAISASGAGTMQVVGSSQQSTFIKVEHV